MNPTGSILLVNDEPAFLETYRTILATEGYSVDAVTDGPSWPAPRTPSRFLVWESP